MPLFRGTVEKLNAGDRDLLRRARAQLESGKRFRQETREETWRDNERQYKGHHWDKIAREDPTADLVTINVSFSTVNTIIPYITGESPRFIVTPRTEDASVRNARLQQAFLNRLWRAIETGADEAFKQSAEDYLIYGDGYMKTTWAIEDKVVGQDDVLEVANIYVDRVSPWNVWLDPNANSIVDARWVCERIYTTKRELEQDPRFEDVDLDKIPHGSLDFTTLDNDVNVDENLDDLHDWVLLWEFYDRVEDVMLVFADSGDMPLRKVRGAGVPIVQLGNYRIPRSPYHMSELEQIWPMQQELNKARSELATHRRRHVAKHFIKEDALTDAAKEAMASPIVGQLVPVKGDQPLDSLVRSANLNVLQPESYNSADQAIRDIYEISGVNEYLRGATPEIRRTATEASIIEGASNVKTRDKLAAVERAVRRIGVMMLAIAKEVFPDTDTDEIGLYLTGDEAEQVNRMEAGVEVAAAIESGDMQAAAQLSQEAQLGGDAIMRPSEEIFQGEYEVEVESNSTELRNPIFKEQKAREMAMAVVQMAPVVAQMGVQLNIRKVLEIWFEAAGISDVEGMFAGGPQPLPEQAFGPGGGVPQGVGPDISNAQAPIQGITAANSGALPAAS